MKLANSLKQFWEIPLLKRRSYCVGEELVTQYPIKDNQEKLFSVKELFAKNKISFLYTPPKEIADLKVKLLLRESAAKRLIKAARRLPKGYKFKISEGYRPLWFQQQIFKEIFEEMKVKYPKLSEKKLWEETTLYVADPSLCPPHSTGGTLDLTIIDNLQKEIDMGTPMNTVGSMSNTFTNGLTKKQKENRLLLLSVMEASGFVNLASEWWHYSYGDQYWAIFNEKKHAIYGKIDKK